MAHINSDILRLGVDVGSTTVKAVALDPADNSVLFTRYQRHNAHQADTVRQLLEEAAGHFPGMRFRIGVCGSGGRPIAAALGACYVQEVVANAAAVRALYPEVRTAVELGGQDAKVIFFRYDEASGKLQTSDMRMNGSCAGGTGAFIDEIAALLNVPADEFEQLAARGKTVYSISGRCGVFAKTDIQPLLIQGAERADIALSTFHAIAKQTIGGLSQGLELTAPIIFEGGPLTFNPTLVRVFAERLNLEERDIVRPDHPETIVARGTAIAIDELFPGQEDAMTLAEAMERLDKAPAQTEGPSGTGRPFFASDEEREVFLRRHRAELRQPVDAAERKVLRGYIGIDSGSTTSKFVFIDENEQVTDTFYANNQGEPLKVVREGLLALAEKYEKLGIQLEVLGLGTTGYGEQMLSAAFHADYHTVETVAHARGCRRFFPDATFLLDIGGQDMKAIWLKDGVVTNIMLNEACSSGCGSFLENFAATLGMPVDQVADAAFRSQAPAELGSRCTVFMNSTIINEQRNGKQPDDLMAGLCRSIIENVFTKVVRIANVAELGDRVVVQGGTFRNFAVLRALEEYLGRDVTLAPYPGEMGALGAALAVKQEVEAHGYANGRCSAFIGFDAVSSSAEETINPNKTLPRGILISLAVSTVLYIVMTLIMTGVVPYKEFANFIDAPVAGVILETGLNWLAFVVNLGALIGMTTVMLVQLYGQSRICYAMSRDGLFPKFFGEVHPKYRTPFKGTWFFGILTAIAGGFININVLFELVNIGTLSAFIIVSAGILWMRKTQPDAHRGFRAPGVPFTPICAIIFCFILICGLNWETWVRFAIWFALGLIVYFVYSRKHSALNEPGLF